MSYQPNCAHEVYKRIEEKDKGKLPDNEQTRKYVCYYMQVAIYGHKDAAETYMKMIMRRVDPVHRDFVTELLTEITIDPEERLFFTCNKG